jgi:hypothetical protein
MEITKARLKQIIMEEIQKFMVVDEGDNPAAEEAVDDAKTALEQGDEEEAEKELEAAKALVNQKD